MRRPRVRVVVVNYNGGGTTMACLHSLLATRWPAGDLEVVMVDNDSTDGVVQSVKAQLPEVVVVEAGSNRGFAGGCNLAMHDLSEVDYVALVNNDATVEPGWLEPLVGALEADPGLGAACPKILFATEFVDVTLQSSTGVRGMGDRRPLGVQLSGARLDGQPGFGRLQLVDGFWGIEHHNDGEASFQWSRGDARIRVPVRADRSLPRAELRLSADATRVVAVESGAERAELRVTRQPGWFEVPVGGEPFSVVNNAGSVLLAGGYGADRGYQEADYGQFDQPQEVFAWCGAAVLLARRYLESVGLFDDRYFLYYEDFDLSWRGRARGWRYLYIPTSVVHHLHSATSIEGSRLFAHYVERNRLLTLTRNAPLPMVGEEVVRHLLITASYARRDLLSPLVRARPPTLETVRRRLSSLAAYGRRLPATLVDRRRLRRAQSVDARRLVEEWATTR